MCAVPDLCGKMVLAYRIGGDMTSSPVTDTVRDARMTVRQRKIFRDAESGVPVPEKISMSSGG